ncbi:hypothetical protein EI94DRAFT_1695839 [Lactarius quietus]|nr:hypothetical protein EI94DRAFT_1695839 [Lactarius quietus]
MFVKIASGFINCIDLFQVIQNFKGSSANCLDSPNGQTGWGAQQMHTVGFSPDDNSQGPPFGFLDPNAVIHMVHLIPVYDMGHTRKPLQMPSIADQSHDHEEGEFEVYYVGITLLADTHKKVQQSDAADDSEEEDNEEGSEEDEEDEEGDESDRVDKICDWSQSCQVTRAGTKKDKEFGNIGGDPSMTVTSCGVSQFLGKSGPLYDNTVKESVSRLGTPHPTLKLSQHVQLNITGCLQVMGHGLVLDLKMQPKAVGKKLGGLHYHPAQSRCISWGPWPDMVPGSQCISASDDRELDDEGEVIEERDEDEEDEDEDNDWDEVDEAFDRAANDEEITMAAGFVAL